MSSGRREPSLMQTTVALPDRTYSDKIVFCQLEIITGAGGVTLVRARRYVSLL